MSMSWSRPTAFIIIAGLIFGVLAALMTEWGNPVNMGVCVACFLRDVAGGIGLHEVPGVRYIRPEIVGFVLGSLVAAVAFREFRGRGGSAPLVRFLLGAFVMIGALVFLGCPVRAVLRLAGGDLNGITALAGIIFGVLVGIFFLRRGFNLGRSRKTYEFAGWIFPVLIVGLALLAIFTPWFIEQFESQSGPGSVHAAVAASLAVGAGVGFLAQRTRLCFVGGWRDLFLVKDAHLFSGIAAFFVAAFFANLALGHVDWGFVGQPAAHDDHLWNFLSMALVGLGATFLGGCPLRQLILSGEGDTDAAVTILGLIVGAAVAHNFVLASSGAGPSDWGPVAVIVGLAFCLSVGLFMREKV
jgi:YedE family putative selenium metabolism protein